jgi:hypothetical protein
MEANSAGPINASTSYRVRIVTIGRSSVRNAGLDSNGLVKGHSPADTPYVLSSDITGEDDNYEHGAELMAGISGHQNHDQAGSFDRQDDKYVYKADKLVKLIYKITVY